MRVVDGDTLRVRKVEGRRTFTVDLLGIDAPEMGDQGTPDECGGRDARSQLLAWTFPDPADTDADGLFDAENAETGARVRLRVDPPQGPYDDAGRALAYVTVLSGASVGGPFDANKRMISAGWAAVADTAPEFERADAYANAAQDAEGANLGVHALCGGEFHRLADEQ